MFRGKNQESAKLIDKAALYDTAEAMELVAKHPAKFDETVDSSTRSWALTPVTPTSRCAAPSSSPRHRQDPARAGAFAR